MSLFTDSLMAAGEVPGRQECVLLSAGGAPYTSLHCTALQCVQEVASAVMLLKYVKPVQETVEVPKVKTMSCFFCNEHFNEHIKR